MPRVLIVASGTLGDALPMLYLGVGLEARGHEVRVLCVPQLRGHAERLGLTMIVQDLNDPEAVMKVIREREHGSYVARSWARLQQIFRAPFLPTFEQMSRERPHLEWCDVAVISFLLSQLCQVAEQVGRPSLLLHPTPSLPTGAYPHPVGPLWWHLLPKPGLANLLTHRAWSALLAHTSRDWTDEFRETHLGLPPSTDPLALTPRLVAASTAIFGRPADWPAHWQMTGYLYDPTPPASAPDEVEAFLAAGEPPVVVGFSSTLVPPAFWEATLGPLVRRGWRLLVVAGWSSVPDSLRHPNVLVVPSVPYAAIFERAACVVHACGIGTLSETVRLATPSVAVPVFGEQKLLAVHAYRRRLVPRPVMLHELTAETLEERLAEAIGSETLRAAREATSRRMREEHAMTVSCEFVERVLHAAASPVPASA